MPLAANGAKFCTKCKTDKPVEDFSKNPTAKDGCAYWCRSCHSDYGKLYQVTKRSPVKVRNNRIKYKYGVTGEQFEKMQHEQRCLCAICHQPQQTNTGHVGRTLNYLDIDHNHETGKVRGLLCRKCNTALGKFGTVGMLRAALAYLKSCGEYQKAA